MVYTIWPQKWVYREIYNAINDGVSGYSRDGKIQTFEKNK
jgi:hypothetical protein